MADPVVDPKVAAQNLKADEAAGAGDADDDEPEPQGDLKVALKQERQKRQAAQKQLKETTEKLSQVGPLAEEYEALLPYLPQILAQGDAKAKKVQQETADQEALEYAQVMGLRDEDGNPDISRARKAIDFHDRRTGVQVRRGTAPAARAAAVAQVQDIKARAYAARDEQGRLYATRQAIDRVFAQIPPEALTNPDNAVAALIMARGLGGPGSEEAPEPVYSERGGRTPGRAKVMSEEAKVIARIRGKSDKEWVALDDNPTETGWDLE